MVEIVRHATTCNRRPRHTTLIKHSFFDNTKFHEKSIPVYIDDTLRYPQHITQSVHTKLLFRIADALLNLIKATLNKFGIQYTSLFYNDTNILLVVIVAAVFTIYLIQICCGWWWYKRVLFIFMWIYCWWVMRYNEAGMYLYLLSVFWLKTPICDTSST